MPVIAVEVPLQPPRAPGTATALLRVQRLYLGGSEPTTRSTCQGTTTVAVAGSTMADTFRKQGVMPAPGLHTPAGNDGATADPCSGNNLAAPTVTATFPEPGTTSRANGAHGHEFPGAPAGQVNRPQVCKNLAAQAAARGRRPAFQVAAHRNHTLPAIALTGPVRPAGFDAVQAADGQTAKALARQVLKLLLAADGRLLASAALGFARGQFARDQLADIPAVTDGTPDDLIMMISASKTRNSEVTEPLSGQINE